MQLDQGDIAILVLLDLSAAFDTIDHAILIDWLEKWVGISSVALNCFSFYLAIGSGHQELPCAESTYSAQVSGRDQ